VPLEIRQRAAGGHGEVPGAARDAARERQLPLPSEDRRDQRASGRRRAEPLGVLADRIEAVDHDL
jgi:hypothetical protein